MHTLHARFIPPSARFCTTVILGSGLQESNKPMCVFQTPGNAAGSVWFIQDFGLTSPLSQWQFLREVQTAFSPSSQGQRQPMHKNCSPQIKLMEDIMVIICHSSEEFLELSDNPASQLPVTAGRGANGGQTGRNVPIWKPLVAEEGPRVTTRNDWFH